MNVRVSALLTLLCASTLSAQQPAQTQTQLPKGQMPDLGRPTKTTDALPLFNFDEYFTGTWTFEWDMPDGPLGESGRATGTTIYKVIDAGKNYAADSTVTGADGKTFTVHEVIAYQQEGKTLSRYVTDSRGFAYLELATVGGDLGGIYNLLYESAPFTFNGATVRIKHTMRLLSPFNYRVATTVSVNGGPFRNYGTPWWRKDAAASSK